MNVISTKVLIENFPAEKHAAKFGFVTNFGIAVGVWVCFLVGAVLPDMNGDADVYLDD